MTPASGGTTRPETEAATFAEEVRTGARFRFGENWARFLAKVNENRIARAEDSLKAMLDCETLQGKTFLDVGSGSGLFSLAARRLGARVRSFDYDPRSVACTAELKRRYCGDDADWVIEEGSVLDRAFVESLPRADVVYSWGVLHHTGAMWEALANVLIPVAQGGRLYVALYNDQGHASRCWLLVKRAYNRLPGPFRLPILVGACAWLWLPGLLGELFNRRSPLTKWKASVEGPRGMDAWRDVVDWVGGLPYEVARPGEVFDFYRERGFELRRLVSVVRHGCNEYVFQRVG